MSVAKTIAARGISFQIGQTTLPPQDFTVDKLLQEVARFNDGARLPGLADDLNAEMLDPEKVRSFVEGLPGLGEKEILLMAGRTVRLNFAAMRLHQSSAVTIQQLRAGYRIGHDPDNANPHLARVRLIAPMSSELARTRIQAARNAVAQRDAQLRDLAGSPATTGNLEQAARSRQERRSAAMVWLALALELSRQHPVPTDAAALVEEAKKALESESVAPATGGMPG